MSEDIQQNHRHEYSPQEQLWRFRWALLYFNGTALLLSIPASVIIAYLTHSPIPGLAPASFTASMIWLIRGAFSQAAELKEEESAADKVKRSGPISSAMIKSLPPSTSP